MQLPSQPRPIRARARIGARPAAGVALALLAMLAIAPASLGVELARPATSLLERIDPGVTLPRDRVRIGLEHPDDAVLLGARGGAFRVLDGVSGAPLFEERAEGALRVVAEGDPAARPTRVHRVQVGSFADEGRARRLAAELEAEHRARGSAVFEPARGVWRVRLGEAKDPAALEGLVAALRESDYPDAWITSELEGLAEKPGLRLVDERWRSVAVPSGRVVFVPEGRGLLTVENERYRGLVEVLATPAGGVQAVNEIGLEDYLRGVVPRELGPAAWPELEALRAQTIAARTYMLANIGQYAEDGYDICATPRCQVYGGVEAEHPLSDRAIRETRGEILVYEGRPINAMYTSTCGGHTEDLKVVFPDMRGEYLRGVPCVAEEEELARRRIGLAGRPLPPGAPGSQEARDPLALSVLAATRVLPRAALDPAWRSEPLGAVEAETILGAFAEAAGLPAPAPFAAPPTRLEVWRRWSAHSGGAGAGLVRPGAARAVLSVADEEALPAEVRLPVAELVARGIVRPNEAGYLRPEGQPSRGELVGEVLRAAELYGLLEMREGRILGRVGAGLRIGERRRESTWRLDPPPELLAASGGAWHRLERAEVAPGDRVRFVTGAGGRLLVLALEERRARDDDRYSSRYRWTAVRDRGELERQLSRVAPVGRLKDLRILERGVSGRVARLEVEGSKGSAVVEGFRIRRALGLLETLFEVELQRDEAGFVRRAIFRGRGWGHGVGMCQVGAYGRALRGETYREILTHYYSGARLVRVALPPRR